MREILSIGPLLGSSSGKRIRITVRDNGIHKVLELYYDWFSKLTETEAKAAILGLIDFWDRTRIDAPQLSSLKGNL